MSSVSWWKKAINLSHFTSEAPRTSLDFISMNWRPQALVKFDQRASKRDDETIDLEEFIAVKGL